MDKPVSLLVISKTKETGVFKKKLEAYGFKPDFETTEDMSSIIEASQVPRWNAVLIDSNDGSEILEVLTFVRGKKSGIPVLCVLGSDCTKPPHIDPALGPYDFIYSDRLEGLGAVLDKKLVNAELRRDERKYRTIIETARELIVTYDLEGKITYANPSATDISGYTCEELEDKNMSEIIVIRTIERESNRYYYAADLVTKSGDTVPLEVFTMVLEDKAELTQIFAIARDTTRRRKAEAKAIRHQEELFQAAKLASLGTLVSGVAHEISNPITSVLLNSPVIKKVWESVLPVLDRYSESHGNFSVGGMSWSQVRLRMPTLLDDILGGAKRVRSIVGELKDFARKGPPEMRESVNVNVVVKSSIGIVSNLIGKSTVDFSVELDEEVPLVTGNAQKIEQVVINLLVNACQALTSIEQAISLSTFYDEEDNEIVIEIQDQGKGIPKETLSRIKDPFFTTKYDTGGTGLGLSISDRIIHDHRGTLEFFSAPGKGTKAVVKLPA